MRKYIDYGNLKLIPEWFEDKLAKFFKEEDLVGILTELEQEQIEKISDFLSIAEMFYYCDEIPDFIRNYIDYKNKIKNYPKSLKDKLERQLKDIDNEKYKGMFIVWLNRYLHIADEALNIAKQFKNKDEFNKFLQKVSIEWWYYNNKKIKRRIQWIENIWMYGSAIHDIWNTAEWLLEQSDFNGNFAKRVNNLRKVKGKRQFKK